MDFSANKSVDNRWRNVYWFARMLIGQDKYGGIGNRNKFLNRIASSLRLTKEENSELTDPEIVALQKKVLDNIFEDKFRDGTKIINKARNLASDLKEMIITSEDFEVLIFTCEQVMIPINNAIDNVPSDDKEFALSICRTFLDEQGQAGLAKVINLWDDLGSRGCMAAERTEIIRAFATLRVLLSDEYDVTEREKDMIMTAFVQEFERRVGQKRSRRAGGSLEDVTSFILGYYNLPTTHEPEHFDSDLEVDKWVPIEDGWTIGISCKRTLRERWKNLSSADSHTLGRHKIKYIYHVITYDEDLSDDKLTNLGAQRQVFYLRDESRVYLRAKNHDGLKDYVRPMSSFINDLKAQIG